VRLSNWCVGAPIHAQGGAVVAAISVSGPLQAFQGSAFDQIVSQVMLHADRLSLRLGYAERAAIRA